MVYRLVMRIFLNGEARELPARLTVDQLVRDLGLHERRVAVELNRSILPREEYSERALREDDAVEIVHFVGGG